MAEDTTYRNALALNSMLLEYRLESVLGAGGFGMTYLGWDTHLEKHVAIKEYLPGELAVRALDGSVVPVNTEHAYNYQWGLERFIQEARTLAKFSHPNIVRVNRFFEANGTSYMVMDYEAGESLHQYLQRVPMPDEAALKVILYPILDGLQAIHLAGFLHRDIKPSNVFIRENGSPVLIDFGSSRLLAGRLTKSLTAIVSPGYAPLEQYSNDGNQGSWSDIYALSGVLYRAVTGENPPDAIRRLKADDVPASLTAAQTRYDARFLKAIEWGLQVDEKLRPQSVVEWRELFDGGVPPPALTRVRASTPPAAVTQMPAPTVVPTQRATRTSLVTPRRWRWLRRGAFVVAIALALGVLFKQRAMEREIKQQAAQPSAELQRQATQRFEAADADRSGDLSRAEMQLRLPRFAGRFDQIDTNRDGTISLRELEQFLEKDGIAQEMRQADAPAEPPPAAKPKPVAREVVAAPAPVTRDGLKAATGDIPFAMRKAFIAADVDGDGFLSHAEVRGHFPVVDQNFAQVDRNRDGRLSLDELWQYRKDTFGARPPRPRP